jgi:uncharacterized repeat protein (TIGR03803 family)
MPRKASFQPHLVLFVLVAVFISLATNPAVAGTEATLHNFAAQGHGAAPQGGLISDAAGNLYGVSATGGAYNSGTVFEFVPNQQGGWDQKILYTFKGGSDGLYPEGQLVFDGAGNLYGTTYWGGKAGSCISGGCGTIFELKHNPDGSWTESILKTFDNDKYGGDLEYGLVFDKAGNLYGTSWVGGANQGGIVFELSPSTDGTWTETILYGFTFGGGNAPPPSWPKGRIVFDDAGNIYGVLSVGGNGCPGGCGAVYELSPASGGNWNLTILHYFTAGPSDGAFPETGLIMDQAGNLYGTTDDGGTGTGTGCNYGCGTVFKMTRTGNGPWTESILYNFQGTNDGKAPENELVFDAAGNLYGTTYDGGGLGTCSDGGCGTVFELTPSGGTWTENVLWKFSGITDGANPSSGVLLTPSGQLFGETFSGSNAGQNGTVFSLTPSSGNWSLASLSNFVNTDGEYPTAGLVADAAGNLYGTTAGGGSLGLGAVFQLSPANGGGWNEKVIYSFLKGNLHYYYIPSGTFPSALIIDAAGNLYGETQNGGEHNAGMVYELSPSAGGTWTEKTLYNFTPGGNGNDPFGGLVMDRAGNLYGTTALGGIGSVRGNSQSGNGVVFELAPGANGVWSEKVIYEFAGYPSDGSRPEAGLFLDQAGNLYGTTLQGGDGTCVGANGATVGCGTVFELTPQGSVWQETVLYSFLDSQEDGLYPSASPVMDSAGHIFGTTFKGGSGNSHCTSCGTVFELSPKVGGGWGERRLFNFPDIDQGIYPVSNLIIDGAGNLYGTTSEKVTGCNYLGYACGTVFQLSPSSGGGYTYDVLYNFTDIPPDGGAPHDGLIFGADGSLYGTTENGGNANEGVVFAITP